MDKKGNILVPGMNEAVAQLTEEEKKLYEKIEFDMEEYCKDVGASKLLHNTKVCTEFNVLGLSMDIAPL